MRIEVFPAASDEPYIAIYSQNGKMTWDFAYLNDRIKIGAEIANELKTLGIDCEIREKKAVCIDYFDLDRIEQV